MKYNFKLLILLFLSLNYSVCFIMNLRINNKKMSYHNKNIDNKINKLYNDIKKLKKLENKFNNNENYCYYLNKNFNIKFNKNNIVKYLDLLYNYSNITQKLVYNITNKTNI